MGDGQVGLLIRASVNNREVQDAPAPPQYAFGIPERGMIEPYPFRGIRLALEAGGAVARMEAYKKRAGPAIRPLLTTIFMLSPRCGPRVRPGSRAGSAADV